MLKAIAFDLWETLITNTPEISQAQKRMRIRGMEAVLDAHGHHAEAVHIERAHHMSWERCHALYWSEDRDIPCRRQVEVFLDELGIDHTKLEESTLADLEAAYANAAVSILPSVVPGARDLLERLKEKGFRTGLISNTGRTPGYALREILEHLDLAPLIDAMVFSDEHGACKPVPTIFEALRSSLGVKYPELLFVGDNLYVDILGAKRCGMRAVHFTPPVRGTAVAPHVEADVEADATVRSLRELLPIVEGLRREE